MNRLSESEKYLSNRTIGYCLMLCQTNFLGYRVKLQKPTTEVHPYIGRKLSILRELFTHFLGILTQADDYVEDKKVFKIHCLKRDFF